MHCTTTQNDGIFGELVPASLQSMLYSTNPLGVAVEEFVTMVIEMGLCQHVVEVTKGFRGV